MKEKKQKRFLFHNITETFIPVSLGSSTIVPCAKTLNNALKLMVAIFLNNELIVIHLVMMWKCEGKEIKKISFPYYNRNIYTRYSRV